MKIETDFSKPLVIHFALSIELLRCIFTDNSVGTSLTIAQMVENSLAFRDSVESKQMASFQDEVAKAYPDEVLIQPSANEMKNGN